MGEFTFKLSLWFTHPEADLSDVPSRLELKPHRIWKKGDNRVTPRGQNVGGSYDKSYCCLRFDEDHGAGVNASLIAALAKLEPHKAYLQELTAHGVKLSFFIGLFVDGQSRVILDWQVSRSVADLHISVDFDIYGPFESSDTDSEP